MASNVIKLNGTMEQHRFLNAMSSRNFEGGKRSSSKIRVRYCPKVKVFWFKDYRGVTIMGTRLEDLFRFSLRVV